MRSKKSVLKKIRQISLTELALLEMSNEPKIETKMRGSDVVTITSKEVYIWAALMAHVAEQAPQTDVIELVGAALEPSSKRIRDYYRKFPYQADSIGLPVQHSDFGLVSLESAIRKFSLKTSVQDVVESARKSYQTLMEKELIEDPLHILVDGVMMLAVLGLLPTGFTRKTKQGKIVSKKIKAMYWSYEKSESRGVTTTSVEVRLLKMIKLFREGFVGAVKNAMKDADEGS